VEETGVPGENHRPVASHWKTLSHNVVSSTPHLNGIVTWAVSFHNIVISFFYTSRCLVLQSHQITVKQNSPAVTLIQLIAVINVSIYLYNFIRLW
jgi:hypothetical protein